MIDPDADDRAREIGDAICDWVVGLTDGLDLAAGVDVDGELEMSTMAAISPDAPALPFVVAELLSLTASATGEDARFPRVSIQQADVVAYSFEIVPVVDFAVPDAADRLLKALVARMRRSLWADDTLGGKVTATSRDFRVEFDEPVIEWENGVVGRQAVVSMHVADVVHPQSAGQWWVTQ